jgi:hypothetical protein
MKRCAMLPLQNRNLCPCWSMFYRCSTTSSTLGVMTYFAGSDYRELGELEGALAKHAEAVFSTLRPEEQRAFPLVMRCLVTLG